MQNFHEEILIFERSINLDYNKIHGYQNHTVKDRKYYPITLPYDPESVVDSMFLTLKEEQNILDRH